MSNSSGTGTKIATAALELFITQGIKKTSMFEIAVQAGVTRITVYRYFSDKQALIQAAFFQIIDVLQSTLVEIENMPQNSLEAYLDCIMAKLPQLRQTDLPNGLIELERLLPQVATEFHAARRDAIQKIFDFLFTHARQQGCLREGLNEAVTQTYFMSAVINILENYELVALELPLEEIFATIKTIFLYGICTKPESISSKAPPG